MRQNMHNFRVFGPDETQSNQLQALYEVGKKVLEKWPVDWFKTLLPRHLEIIYEINASSILFAPLTRTRRPAAQYFGNRGIVSVVKNHDHSDSFESQAGVRQRIAQHGDPRDPKVDAISVCVLTNLVWILITSSKFLAWVSFCAKAQGAVTVSVA